MMQYLTLAIVGALVAAFAWRTLSRGRLAVASRRDGAFEIADTAVVLAAARALVPWGTVGTWWWYAAILAFAVGVAAIVLRWPSLPATGKRGRLGRAGTVIHIAVLVGVLSLCVFVA